ncbi:pentapeptide repeat-containing protein [Candidatus Uabimicrobium sp. HlEnr_7]|uniref:pentapeptide repeat-containing protein n=1 Tax=Candidatus Uabimicrobium helgolandensis TaxID=3095367 RepID=UPI003556B815
MFKKFFTTTKNNKISIEECLNIISKETQSTKKERQKAINKLLQTNHRDFSNVDLSELELCSQNFSDMTLSNINFARADLSSCCFNNTKIFLVNFTAADLHSARFESTYLERVRFNNAKMSKCQFTRSELHRVNLESACLVSAILEDTSFKKTTLKNSIMSFACFRCPISYRQLAECKDLLGIRGFNVDFLRKIRKLNPKLMEWWDGLSRINYELWHEWRKEHPEADYESWYEWMKEYY